MPLPPPPAPLHARLIPPDLAAQPLLPLAGLTLLAVEDSRFACDALRLLCQRSGARLRRADSLHAARAHLSVYRPDVVIIDLGLPDGRGESLIRDLAQRGPGRPRLLGCSGAPDGRSTALEAGADGFLDKPLPGLAAFHLAVLGLPPLPAGLPEADRLPLPDPLALQDDLATARLLASRLIGPLLREGYGARSDDTMPGQAEPATPLTGNPPNLPLTTAGQQAGRAYLAGFVASLARSSRDTALGQAAEAARHTPAGLQRLDHLLAERIGGDQAFTPGDRP